MTPGRILDRWFAGNPLYRPASHRRTRGDRFVTLVAAVVGGLFYLQVLVGPIADSGGRSLSVIFLAGLVQWPVALMVHLFAPALAATAVAAERTRGTLEMLVVSPFPRRPMLLGMVAERLRPIAMCLLLCLPGYLIQGLFWQSAWGVAGVLLGLLGGSSNLCGLALTGAAGLNASARVRSEAGAVAYACVVVVVLRWIIGMASGLVFLLAWFFRRIWTPAATHLTIVLFTMACELLLAWSLFHTAAKRMENALEE